MPAFVKREPDFSRGSAHPAMQPSICAAHPATSSYRDDRFAFSGEHADWDLLRKRGRTEG
jgi:hypothetical protein